MFLFKVPLLGRREKVSLFLKERKFSTINCCNIYYLIDYIINRCKFRDFFSAKQMYMPINAKYLYCKCEFFTCCLFVREKVHIFAV